LDPVDAGRRYVITMRLNFNTEPTDLPNIDQLLERSDVLAGSVPHMRIGGS